MSASSAKQLPNPPTFLEHDKYKGLKFLIFDAPNSDNLKEYIALFKKYGVTHVVRTCEHTYSRELIEAEGIKHTDLPYTDGGQPPSDVINQWREIVMGVKKSGGTVGVHCVAGLGRAPVLVSIIFIEAGMQPLEAVDFIRQKRRGAINATQLKYLRNYKKPSDCIIQ